METNSKHTQLQRLHRGICRCQKCPLHQNRTHAVPGEGPPQSDIIFVGEAPSKMLIKDTGPDALPLVELTKAPLGLKWEKLNPVPPPL